MKTSYWIALLVLTATAAAWVGRETATRYELIKYGSGSYNLQKLDRWTGKTWMFRRTENTWTPSETEAVNRYRTWDPFSDEKAIPLTPVGKSITNPTASTR